MTKEMPCGEISTITFEEEVFLPKITKKDYRKLYWVIGFSFPSDVHCPCLPIVTKDNTLLFPVTYDGTIHHNNTRENAYI